MIEKKEELNALNIEEKKLAYAPPKLINLDIANTESGLLANGPTENASYRTGS